MLRLVPSRTTHPADGRATGRAGATRCLLPLLALSSAALAGAPAHSHVARPIVQPNANIERAGVLHDGVLTVVLEAKMSAWQLDGPGRPAEIVEAFSEPGRAPVAPGPLVRAPAGTEIRFSVHNSLSRPLTFFVPAWMHGSPERHRIMDSVIVAPGSVGMLTVHATEPGNYFYRATTPDRVNLINDMAGALGGAIVVDAAEAAPAAHDRVFVIMATEDSASVACDDTTTAPPVSECGARRYVYTINGNSWPRTERIHATVGDSLRWRVINVSRLVHPMHLHGFYYRVDDYAGPPRPDDDPGPAPGQMVVTQFMGGYSTMSMTWSPSRPGNWLFHCHIAQHTTSDSLLTPADADMGGMAGLMLGTMVAPRDGAALAANPRGVRHLRLVAVAERDTGANRSARTQAVTRQNAFQCIRCGSHVGNLPTMHFVLEERGRRADTHTDASPEIDLVRGQPVAITIVNRLARPTSVHWHGVEIEDSYMDGAAGFSGEGHHLSPAIAPGDSFVARFTPPRSGTFMYHTHVDEAPEEIAGMEGALIVRDSAASPVTDDHVFLYKGQLRNPEHPVELNGSPDPDTVVLHVGRPARFRLLNLASESTPGPTFSLTARPDSRTEIATDTLVVRWIPVAKDGFDIPAARRTPRLAREIVGVGETYDFEYTPQRRGPMLLEVRGSLGKHALLAHAPIRVE